MRLGGCDIGVEMPSAEELNSHNFLLKWLVVKYVYIDIIFNGFSIWVIALDIDLVGKSSVASIALPWLCVTVCSKGSQ